MPVLEIVTVPEPILRRKARKVSGYGQGLQKLIDDMIETMRQAPGVGLAAPQVNEALRVIVVEYGEVDEEGEEITPTKLYAVVNPEVTRVSAETELGTEGCLSVPDLVGDVERPIAVTVKGFNRHGQPMRIKADGWLGRIFQHEIDHVNGVLFTDRAERIWPLEDQPSQVIPAV
jgi:peptide deformylase